MRVTNKMMTNNFLRDMNVNLNRMQTLQTQLTSGKEFKRPSDDPFKVARSMQLYTDINANKQFNENISDTINWLDTTDTAVGQVNDVFQRIHELMISAGNGGYSDNERAAIKDEINERISEVSQILNSSFDGKYIFGGTRGTTKPLDTEGGVKYLKAPTVKVSDVSKWADTDITITDGTTTETINIPSDVKSAKEIADLINAKTNKTPGLQLEVKHSIAENSLMFVSENGSNISVTTSKTIDDIGGKLNSIEEAVVESSGNTKIKYYGDSGDITDDEKKMINTKLYTEVSSGVNIGYNVSATEILEFRDENGNEINIMETLKNIVNHLDGRSADGGEDLDDESLEELLTNDLGEIKKMLSNVSKVRAKVGAMQNRMDNAKSRNEESNFNMMEILSKNEDIDVAEKTMEYASMQTVYLASLQTSAKILQPSLIDYI